MKKHKLRMGASLEQGIRTKEARKFWNMASISDDEGEITLYGDVMSKQPIDWWTGEPKPGFYITPEGFMDDLAVVKNKSRITVKLNSCGGDLYTGIAIHNALKALTAEINVIVEGIAASAASVIMCAGDNVTVYPGSLIMIHGVSVVLWDSVNVQDMERLMKGMDASERAVAEIYSAKTGMDTETLRGMMADETWMTGREANEKGFADALNETGKNPEMSMTMDRKVLYVNGVAHNIGGLRNIPGTIPVMKMVPKPPHAAGGNRFTASAGKEGGNKFMTIEELRASHPDLVMQIEQEVRTAESELIDKAVTDERNRIQEIDSIAATVPDPEMVDKAKYGKECCTAQELCFRVMKKSAEAGQKFLENYARDGVESGTNTVKAAPNGGAPVDEKEQDAADILAAVNAYVEGKGGSINGKKA